jgi:hypothetical protein
MDRDPGMSQSIQVRLLHPLGPSLLANEASYTDANPFHGNPNDLRPSRDS